MITIKKAIEKAAVMLKVKQIETPKMKARLLMQYTLKKPRQFLIVYDNKVITKEQEIRYFKYVEKLRNGTPLQHITHSQEFMKMNFFVNKDVLIPQPDTEILVQAVIKYINYSLGKDNSKLFEQFEINKKNKFRILDLCTGSGAIAISLAKKFETENFEIFGSDISDTALEVAKINCQKNKAKMKLIKSDLFENINEKFDIIVSNPPYIETDTIETLDLDVQNEPHLALDGGKDGLNFYRKIGKEAKKYLEKDGILFLEIGFNQKEKVKEILEKNNFKNIICIQDYSGNDRVVISN